MSIVKISDLPAASAPVSSLDVVPVVQDGVTKKAALNQLGFLQTGVGAVTRTIQSKLRDTVSPKDFGAVGDGIADDSAAIRAAVLAAGSFNQIVDGGGLTYRISANCTDMEPTDFFGARYFDPGLYAAGGGQGIVGTPSFQNIKFTGAAVIIRRQKFVTWRNVTVAGALRVDGAWHCNLDGIFVQGMQMMGGNGLIDYDDGTSTDGDFWGTYWNFFSNVVCWWQLENIVYPLIFQRSYGPINQNVFKNGVLDHIKAYATNGVVNTPLPGCQNNVIENFDISGSTQAPDANNYQIVWDTQYLGSGPNDGRLIVKDCYFDTGINLYGDVVLDGGFNGAGVGIGLKNYGSYQSASVVMNQGGAARINLTGEGQPFDPGFNKYIWSSATSLPPIWFQTTPFGAAPAWDVDATEPFGYGYAVKTDLVNNGSGQTTTFAPQTGINDGAGMTMTMYWRPVSTNGLYVGEPVSGDPIAYWRFPYGSDGWELLIAHSPGNGVRIIAGGLSGANLEFYVSPAICFAPGLHMQIPAPDSSISFNTPLLIGSGDTTTAYSPWNNVDSRLGNLYGQRLKKQIALNTGATTLVWTITVPINSTLEVEMQIANDLETSNINDHLGYARVCYVITRGKSSGTGTAVVEGQKVIGPASGAGCLNDITAAVVGSDVQISAVFNAASPNVTNNYDTALIMRSITPRTQTITAV